MTDPKKDSYRPPHELDACDELSRGREPRGSEAALDAHGMDPASVAPNDRPGPELMHVASARSRADAVRNAEALPADDDVRYALNLAEASEKFAAVSKMHSDLKVGASPAVLGRFLHKLTEWKEAPEHATEQLALAATRGVLATVPASAWGLELWDDLMPGASRRCSLDELVERARNGDVFRECVQPQWAQWMERSFEQRPVIVSKRMAAALSALIKTEVATANGGTLASLLAAGCKLRRVTQSDVDVLKEARGLRDDVTLNLAIRHALALPPGSRGWVDSALPEGWQEVSDCLVSAGVLARVDESLADRVKYRWDELNIEMGSAAKLAKLLATDPSARSALGSLTPKHRGLVRRRLAAFPAGVLPDVTFLALPIFEHQGTSEAIPATGRLMLTTRGAEVSHKIGLPESMRESLAANQLCHEHATRRGIRLTDTAVFLDKMCAAWPGSTRSVAALMNVLDLQESDLADVAEQPFLYAGTRVVAPEHLVWVEPSDPPVTMLLSGGALVRADEVLAGLDPDDVARLSQCLPRPDYPSPLRAAVEQLARDGCWSGIVLPGDADESWEAWRCAHEALAHSNPEIGLLVFLGKSKARRVSVLAPIRSALAPTRPKVSETPRSSSDTAVDNVVRDAEERGPAEALAPRGSGAEDASWYETVLREPDLNGALSTLDTLGLSLDEVEAIKREGRAVAVVPDAGAAAAVLEIPEIPPKNAETVLGVLPETPAGPNSADPGSRGSPAVGAPAPPQAPAVPPGPTPAIETPAHDADRSATPGPGRPTPGTPSPVRVHGVRPPRHGTPPVGTRGYDAERWMSECMEELRAEGVAFELAPDNEKRDEEFHAESDFIIRKDAREAHIELKSSGSVRDHFFWSARQMQKFARLAASGVKTWLVVVLEEQSAFGPIYWFAEPVDCLRGVSCVAQVQLTTKFLPYSMTDGWPPPDPSEEAVARAVEDVARWSSAATKIRMRIDDALRQPHELPSPADPMAPLRKWLQDGR